jgi:hypothetical protein
LSELGGDYLPEFIASKPEWNAWLMSGEATHVEEVPTEPEKLFRFLNGAIESMGELQIKTQGRRYDLLQSGAFDQSIEVFREHSEALFDYLEEVMGLQTSTKVPRLQRSRIQEIRTIFEEVCQCLEDLGICDTIVHGDVNRGNILSGGGHCQFIDRCEAYVGNPLITLHQLLRLNKLKNPETRHHINLLLKQRYLDIWATRCDPNALARGFVLMPILAAASALYGRGDWLTSQRRHDLGLQGYARTLARHMDRAALALAHGESLCA